MDRDRLLGAVARNSYGALGCHAGQEQAIEARQAHIQLTLIIYASAGWLVQEAPGGPLTVSAPR
jgi:hypothetical protein